MIDLDVLFSAFLTILVGVVAFFLKQLLTDFKKAQTELLEVKSTVNLIKAEFKGYHDLMSQKVDFMERRISRIEKQLFNINEDEK